MQGESVRSRTEHRSKSLGRLLAVSVCLCLITGMTAEAPSSFAKTQKITSVSGQEQYNRHYKPAGAVQSRLDAAESEYAETKEKRTGASDDLENLKSERNSLQSALDTLNTKMTEAADILDGLETNISNTQTEIETTWGRIEELSAVIDELQIKADEEYDTASEQIRFVYENGGDLTNILLTGSGSYAEYLNRAVYLQMFTKYYRDSIEALTETGKELTSTKAEYEKNLMKLEESKAALEDYRATVQEQYEEIQSEVDKAAEQVKTYQDEIEDTEARILRYEKELAEQESDIEALRKQVEEEKRISQQAANASWRDISSVSVDASERKLLANLIWCEAGNEPYVGQVAVGAVVMNRVMSSVFPDTITGVIYQGKQFTPAYTGNLALALSRDSATESCYQAADAAISGVNNIGNSLYFRTPSSSVSPKYTIGGHIFY